MVYFSIWSINFTVKKTRISSKAPCKKARANCHCPPLSQALIIALQHMGLCCKLWSCISCTTLPKHVTPLWHSQTKWNNTNRISDSPTCHIPIYLEKWVLKKYAQRSWNSSTATCHPTFSLREQAWKEVDGKNRKKKLHLHLQKNELHTLKSLNLFEHPLKATSIQAISIVCTFGVASEMENNQWVCEGNKRSKRQAVQIRSRQQCPIMKHVGLCTC